MKFTDLIAARDAAITQDEHCEAANKAAFEAHDAACKALEAASEALAAAHKAIHDRLVEFGEHFTVSPQDGTVTLFKPSELGPGYLAVHPIPGDGPDTETIAK